MAPEVLLNTGHGVAVDWWAYGTLLFEMLAGGPPFPAETAADALGKTLHKEPEWERLPDGLPPRLQLLLNALMRPWLLMVSFVIQARISQMLLQVNALGSALRMVCNLQFRPKGCWR